MNSGINSGIQSIVDRNTNAVTNAIDDTTADGEDISIDANSVVEDAE